MFEISLGPCEHRVHFRQQKDLPRVGDLRYCRFCRLTRTVIVVHPFWRLKCKQCRYGGSRLGLMGIESLANRHMLTNRHTVIIWRTDDMEGSLKICQPATTTQTRIEVAENTGNDGDDPPPF